MTTKVLVQVNSLALGGTQLNAVDFAWALQSRGYDSLLVGPTDSLPTDGPSLMDVATERGVPTRAVDRPTSTIGGARELSRIARQHGSQLVHTYGTWTIRPAFWGPCLLGRRPLVMTVYEMEVDPVVYRAPNLVIGTRYLEEEQVERRGRVRLISPPVDLDRDDGASVQFSEFLAAFGLDPDHQRVVIVTRLDDESLRPVKGLGVEHAIRAVGAHGSRSTDLIIVGTGNDEGRLRRIGDEVNASLGRSAVVFTGAMSDPRPAYACADVMLGMGGSAARSLAFGKPLIVVGEFGWFDTFTSATADANFRNSFWSEEHVADPVEMLLGELLPLLEDERRRRDLGRFSREFATEHFGLDAMADRLAVEYEHALGAYGSTDWLVDARMEAGWSADKLRRRGARIARRPEPETLDSSPERHAHPTTARPR